MVFKKHQPVVRKVVPGAPRPAGELETVHLTFGRSPGRPAVRFVKASRKFSENKDGSPENSTT